MKQRNGRIIVIQAVLVLLMSAAASYSLLPLLPNIGARVFLVFAGLTVIGAAMIFFPKISPILFSLPVIITSLATILSHNILDLGRIQYRYIAYTGMGNEYIELAPELFSFPVVLGLGLFLILGYLALSYLHSLQKDYRAMISGEAEINEVEDVTNRSLSVMSVTLVASVAVAAVVVILLRAAQPVVADFLKDYPWSIIVLGLASVLLLGGLLYWIGVSGKKQAE